MMTSNKVPLIRVDNHPVGPGYPTYVIAEIGINHNGILPYALKLIDAAVDSGADAVKFQKRHLTSLYPGQLIQHPNKDEKGFQYMIPFLQEMELSDDDYRQIVAYCKEREITFLCSPWDLASVDFLETLEVPAYKIASADLTNLPILEYIASYGKPMIVSTGMSTFEEVKTTVAHLERWGAQYALLHCNSTYPCPFEDVNLRFVEILRNEFNVPVGYSGHERGIAISTVAAALGACIIERHITLDRTMEGPDHAASLEPHGFKKLVRDVRWSEAAMGTGEKYYSQGEMLNREILAKSLVAARPIKAGETLTSQIITVKGPGKGLSPQRMDELLGKTAQRDIEQDGLFVEFDLGIDHQTGFLGHIPWDWGIVVRFRDLEHFIGLDPHILEFHFTYEDMLDQPEFGCYSQRLIVHAPEWWHRSLVDLCSLDEAHRRASLEVIQMAIDKARKLSPHFSGKPAVIVHPGAMSLEPTADTGRLVDNLIRSVDELDCTDICLLLENLPPRPWYFGGQWVTNAFMEANQIVDVCNATGVRLCFDTCHAQLFCNLAGTDIVEQTRLLQPYIRHLHFSDAMGIDGEGLQIGEGMINFDRIICALGDGNYSLVPEIWRGHLNGGHGFLVALERLAVFFKERK